MPKYKKINEIIVESFIEKLFSKIGQKKTSKALDALAEKDPQLKKDLKVLSQIRDKMNKRLNTKAKRDAALDRIMKQYG
tara:strand:+ start:172 stop:408 length:237 start_codon:yes stop_codon:yes gene_type:complete